MFSSITGIQYRPSGFAAGYLQFVVVGSQESKGGLQAALNDENTVGFFGKKYNKQAEEIKKYIENYNSTQNNSATFIQNVKSPIEQIKDLKELLDMRAITQEEFETKKKQLLNL